MEQQREIKHRRILKLLEHRAIAAKFLLFREEDPIKLFDADESVFVGRITMIKFVLNEAGERAELRNVAPEESKIVHFAKDPADLAFAREDREESLPRNAGVLEGPIDHPEPSPNGVAQLGAEIQLPT